MMSGMFRSLGMLFNGHANEIYEGDSSTKFRKSLGFSRKRVSAPGCALIICLVTALLSYSPVFAEETKAADENGKFEDFAVLTTSDMHGKCWDTNILTESSEKNNMLHISAMTGATLCTRPEKMFSPPTS